jgi:hypothetical protein
VLTADVLVRCTTSEHPVEVHLAWR